jgi:site-specific DNA recombinase
MSRGSPARAALRAAIYCRISDDRVGAGLGVARQREDCERLVEERGWSVVGIFEDNDISAYTGRRRPGYEALLDRVRADELDVVVAWQVQPIGCAARLRAIGTSLQVS